MHNVPMSFIRSGSYAWYSGNPYNRRSGGAYWSSKAGSGASANYLSFYGSSVNPRSGNLRGNGFAVRCVAH